MPEHTFVERSRHYLGYEYPTKIRLAVESLSDEVIWRRSHDESNSIGNLLLHLAGNIREWIVGGVGGGSVERQRAAEFAARSGPGARELLGRLETTIRDADAVLARIDDADLSRALLIQGRHTTVLAAIYHVVEHFAMHTGQILMLAKAYAPGTVRFYDDADGIAMPLWGGKEGMARRD
jgi:uncharacterized damage-inducible protein DinB